MWNDVKCAWRSLRTRAVLTVTALVVLAAALGFNIAAFSIVNTLLFSPYPYPQLSRLTLIRDQRLVDGAHQGNPIASGDFVDLRRESAALDDVTGWRAQALVLSGNGEPERIEGTATTANFFDVLGVRAEIGRTFAADEDQSGRDDRVVLSHRYWKNRFAADRGLVGRTIMLNGRPTQVIGVISDDACYPPGVDAWVPLTLTPADQTERTSQRIMAIGRLKAGASIARGRQDVERVAETLARRYPTTNEHRSFALLELRKEQYEFTEPLFAFVQIAALFVMLLGAANVINLLVARTEDRRREFGVRFALGATRRRVFALMLAEAITLTITAGVSGVLIAKWSIPLIHAALPEGIARWIAGWQTIDVDRRVVAASAELTLLTGVGLGCVTGWHAVHSAATTTLREGRSGAARLTLLRRGVIVTEVVFALVLLLGAGVTLQGFQRLGAAFQGLGPETVLRFRLALPASRYPDAVRIVEFQDRLLQRIGELPGVAAAGLIRNEPASNVSNPQTPFAIDGRTAVAPSDAPRTDLQTISAGGFHALRLRVGRGRAFTAADGPSTTPVAVISEEMARRFWPDADPLGARIRVGAQAAAWTTVVGVVSDLKLNWYDPVPRPTLYLPHTQSPSPQMYVVVRSTVAPEPLAAPIRAIGARLDPMQPFGQMQRMDEVVRESISPIRVLGLLLLIGGGLAVQFAATGIYSVLAHWVTTRWREFGIRIALGATAADVARVVVRQAIGLAVVGLLIGIPCGLAGLSWLQSRLFGVTTADVPTTVAVSVFVLAIVTAAALAPARRALRADPAILLQSE
jgi:putative ABC transport system permease protein